MTLKALFLKAKVSLFFHLKFFSGFTKAKTSCAGTTESHLIILFSILFPPKTLYQVNLTHDNFLVSSCAFLFLHEHCVDSFTKKVTLSIFLRFSLI